MIAEFVDYLPNFTYYVDFEQDKTYSFKRPLCGESIIYVEGFYYKKVPHKDEREYQFIDCPYSIVFTEILW